MDYRKPTLPYIGKGATRLYSLEERLGALIVRTSAVMADLLIEHDAAPNTANETDRIYKIGMPEVLGSILGYMDRQAAILGAVAFLKKEGYQVIPPVPEGAAPDDDYQRLHQED